jgi:hypothetical protein
MNRQRLIRELDRLIEQCTPDSSEKAVLLTLAGALHTGREAELLRVITPFVEREIALAKRVTTAHLN